MQEHFHTTSVLSKDTLKGLLLRRNNPALRKFVWLYSLFILFHIWIVWAWGSTWYIQVIPYAGFTLCVCSLFACEHETVHRTAFASKKTNDWVAFLAGILHIYPSNIFRDFHFEHHRYTNIPGKDPEISFGGKPVPSVISSIPSHLAWLTGLPLLLFKCLMLIGGIMGFPNWVRRYFFPFIKQESRRRIFIESWIVFLVQAAFLFLAIVVSPAFWAIFIGQVIGHCVLAFYLEMEHNGLPFEGTIFEKTRSMRVSHWVKRLMWNMPYHAEHHAYPAVPFHALPELHSALGDQVLHKEDSHFDFNRKVIRGTFKG